MNTNEHDFSDERFVRMLFDSGLTMSSKEVRQACGCGGRARERFAGMTIEERLQRHLGQTPDVSNANFVAANATVIGDVVLGAQSSVFYGAVLRGDIARIRIGEGTNIQDNCIVHLADEYDAVIGDWCTVGHAAIVHACTVEDECLIGMNATVMDGAHIGRRSLIAAGAVVTPGMQVPPGSMVMGAPGKVVRKMVERELVALRGWAEKYLAVSKAHAARQIARG